MAEKSSSVDVLLLTAAGTSQGQGVVGRNAGYRIHGISLRCQKTTRRTEMTEERKTMHPVSCFLTP